MPFLNLAEQRRAYIAQLLLHAGRFVREAHMLMKINREERGDDYSLDDIGRTEIVSEQIGAMAQRLREPIAPPKEPVPK